MRNVSYIEQPIDATKGVRLVAAEGKECRMFNLSFHHFNDAPAEKVLKSAVDSADAFVKESSYSTNEPLCEGLD